MKASGQRWMWINLGYEHIVEVLPNGSAIVIQIIGTNSAIPNIGTVRTLDFTGNWWVYLEGQDKPLD